MSHVAVGSMRQRIQLQVMTSSSDGQGGQTGGVWTRFLDAWAKVEPLIGQARLMAMDQGTENPTRVSLRYRPGITPAMRILFDGRIFSIVQVINIEELDITLEIHCGEVTG